MLDTITDSKLSGAASDQYQEFQVPKGEEWDIRQVQSNNSTTEGRRTYWVIAESTTSSQKAAVIASKVQGSPNDILEKTFAPGTFVIRHPKSLRVWFENPATTSDSLHWGLIIDRRMVK